VNEQDIISIRIDSNDIKIIEPFIKTSAIGGKSSVRKDSEDRSKNLIRDQALGLLGLYAYNKHMFGHYKRFIEARKKADLNPRKGDQGQDIPGANIDVKTSYIKPDSKLGMGYRLGVRKREERPNWVYVLALVGEPISRNGAVVHLMGWATTSMLPEKPDQTGIFKGAKTIRAYNLKPIPPFRWGIEL
jgi:hypothetical protein